MIRTEDKSEAIERYGVKQQLLYFDIWDLGDVVFISSDSQDRVCTGYDAARDAVALFVNYWDESLGIARDVYGFVDDYSGGFWVARSIQDYDEPTKALRAYLKIVDAG